MKTETSLDDLIYFLSKLPGLGPRSAQRMVLFLLKKKETHFEPLKGLMDAVLSEMKVCPLCGNYDVITPCHICQDTKRSQTTLCVVPDVSDIWALERSPIYHGQYFALGGLLSALDGITPEDLNIQKLKNRLESSPIEEVIFALPLTVDGQTTLHYLIESLKTYPVKLTTLAHGMPVGGELDFQDEGTIQTAFKARTEL